MSYKYFGLQAFLALLAGLLFIIWKWPEGKHLTFSQHVAVSKARIVYYVLLFSLVLPLLLLFFARWFVPTFALSPWFMTFMVVASLTQYGCTLIPEVGGLKTQTHRLLAGISALCLVPPLIILATADSVATMGKLLTLGSLFVMTGIIWAVALGRGKHNYFLLLQSGYFVAFFVPVLWISYLQ